ncbi:anti-repressor SinI family protein [Virgibacillus necropolis]
MSNKNITLDKEWVKLILEAKMQGLGKEEVLAYLEKNRLKVTGI